MKIAISGAGVAGPALAYWLHRTGHTPTLIERAPQFRTGGYVIDFWGLGYRVAQRMGIETAIRGAGYQVGELRLVDREGHTAASVGLDPMRRATDGKFTSLTRGDLAAAIYATIENDVETIFATSITAVCHCSPAKARAWPSPKPTFSQVKSPVRMTIIAAPSRPTRRVCVPSSTVNSSVQASSSRSSRRGLHWVFGCAT